MLNAILMREREQPMLEPTRDWLASDERNALTLVVDELHTYRGTQGSEVALVVRNLLRRLGLAPDSPQLRCIGTSASLDGEEGWGYLEEFFGVDRRDLPGHRGRAPRELPELAASATGSGAPSPRGERSTGCRRGARRGLPRRARPRRGAPLPTVAERLCRRAPTTASALEPALEELADRPEHRTPIPFRSHHFRAWSGGCGRAPTRNANC